MSSSQSKYKEFWYALIIICVVMSGLIFSVILYNYYSYTQKNEEHAKQVKIKVENMVNEIFNFTVSAFKNYGIQISNFSPTSNNQIKKIFHNDAYEDNPLKIWTGLSWVDENNYLKADSLKECKKNEKFPIRSSFKKVKETPWKAIFSPPEIGFQSEILILPVAMGITNNKNKHIGYISAGLSLIDITKKIYEITRAMPFVVLDKNYKVIAKSPNININLNSFHIKKYIEEKKLEINKEQVNFKFKNILFKELLSFPEKNLIILLGVDQNFMHKEFVLEVLPKVIETIAVWIFFVLLLWIYQKRIIKRTIEDSWEQEKTINLIVDRVRLPLVEIHKKCIDLCTHMKKGNIQNEKMRAEINQISDNIKNLLVPMLGKLSYSNFDAKETIEECIIVFKNQMTKEEINLTTKFNFKKLNIEADKNVFKQIIIGVILLSINQTPKKGTITLHCKKINYNNNQFLEIKVTDNGFGFSETELTQMFNRVGIKSNARKYGVSIDLNSIQQLVLQHNGKLTTHKNNRGRSIIVHIPISGISFRSSNVKLFLKQD